jgi:hypothetical protein
MEMTLEFKAMIDKIVTEKAEAQVAMALAEERRRRKKRHKSGHDSSDHTRHRARSNSESR